MPINSNSVLKLALGLSIMIILNLLFNYGIDIFFKEPKFEDYCGSVIRRPYPDKTSCETVGGMWQENIPIEKIPSATNAPTAVGVASAVVGYCDATFKCSQELQSADNLYKRNAFLIMISLGFISCVLGFLVFKNWPIAFGFSYGGLIAFFVSAVKYWSSVDDKLRFFSLISILLGLILIGYFKFKEQSK